MLKEYRICMPISVEEYRIGQLYMIARHSDEQSEDGEGVQVINNSPCVSKAGSNGQFTEKRIHLSKKVPSWAQSYVPKWIYATEKAWNYFPYTETEYSCSFIPKLNIKIWTRYEDNNGSSDNCLDFNEEQLDSRVVEDVDIIEDVGEKSYKVEEDPLLFVSEKTKRGPLKKGWRDNADPIMCSYKAVDFSFPVFGLQNMVEDLIFKNIRFILLLGHRQAYVWIDQWLGMTIEDVRNYESEMHKKTNEKIVKAQTTAAAAMAEEAEEATERIDIPLTKKRSLSEISTPRTPGGSSIFASIFKWTKDNNTI